jgi:chaperonin GroES
MIREDLQQKIESLNLCDEYSQEDLKHLGLKICQWFDEDFEVRKPWYDKSEQWLKLATQVVEKKTYPWPDAANVKFPLLTTAAMQFAARAYPALVPGPNLVAGLVIGRDEQGVKQQQAERVGKHMSYQLLYEMPGWEEDMDRLCLMLPIVGCLFKKTYYNDIEKQNCSELVLPQDLIIDYYAKTVEDANRKSHVLYYTKNQYIEKVNKGLFKDVDLKDAQSLEPDFKIKNQIQSINEPQVTPATPHKFIECHCWWDLDEDDYDEPYVVTVHYETKQPVRIVARFDTDGIELGDDGKLVRIKPIEYFTKFGFIPNPDGSIYDLGFGLLLGGINESVNTLTNQLLDSGTINNLQSGFLGRGIRIRGGNTRFIPGEWKPVDFTGDDIKKHIFPLPTKEPSNVLFQLLETLVTSGKELASVAEIFVGKMPGQNTPATTTMATIEQGLKVFTAIYKRIYRSLGKEYDKLFRLNSIYADDTIYFTINEPQGPTNQEVYRTDYNQDNLAIKPNADPNVVSSAQRLMKIESLGQLLQLGTINPQVYTKRYLEAIDAENIAELMNVQPQPSPEEKKMQMEGQIKAQESQQKMQLEQMKGMLDKQDKEMDMRFKMFEAQMKEREMTMKLHAQAAEHQLNMKAAVETHHMDMTAAQQSHNLRMDTAQESHDLKQKQMKEKAAQPQPKKGK